MEKRIALIGDNSIEYINLLLDIWDDQDCAVLIDSRIPFLVALNMMEDALVEKCYIERNLLEINCDYNTDIKIITFERKSNSPELVPCEFFDRFKINYSLNEAVIIYSSGTTGKAKGIILSYFSINTNADAIIDYMGLTSEDSIYIAKPFAHSSTLVGELLVGLKQKIRIIVAPTVVPPRYHLRSLVRLGASILCLNPMMLSIYIDEYKTKTYYLTTLKTIYVSGTILSDKLYNEAKQTFKNINIFNVYGLSEAGPRVCAQTTDCCSENSVGKPIKDVKVIIVDKIGQEVTQGKIGIVHVKTPSIFIGYVSENKKMDTFYLDWLNTGDLGFADKNNCIHIVGRADDMIIQGTHKIYPYDLENVILKFSFINECVVLGIKDNFLNQKLICFYISNQEEDIISELLKYLSINLPIYEIPKKFIKVDIIPRNKNGKIDKITLINQYGGYLNE